MRGLNALFTPPPERVEAARRALALWERLRARGRTVGTSDGTLVDHRSVRRARAIVAQADAIARRERAR